MELAPDSAPANAPASDTGTPVEVPTTVILAAPMTCTAAILRLPATRMPASPAFTSPFGAMRLTRPAVSPGPRQKLSDAAADHGIGGIDEGVSLGIGLNGRRRCRRGALGARTRVYI